MMACFYELVDDKLIQNELALKFDYVVSSYHLLDNAECPLLEIWRNCEMVVCEHSGYSAYFLPMLV